MGDKQYLLLLFECKIGDFETALLVSFIKETLLILLLRHILRHPRWQQSQITGSM